jgi:diadenosine tetraphosphate (Ap4A) HIT family hydrolase
MDMEAYVRRVRTADRCFICAIGAGEPGFEHEVVFHDDGEHIAFLSRYPTVYGYALVSPREHVEHIVRERDLDAYLRTQAVVYRVARAVEAVVEPERTYVASLGSQQGNRHQHWHIVPLPPGTPYEEQQLEAMQTSNGILDWSVERAEDLGARLAAALAGQLGA